MPIFEHRSVINAPVDALMDFHQHPKAFQRLTPPPIFVQIHRNALESLQQGEVEFTLWFGPVPVRWLAEHDHGPIETSFVDRQLKGPLQRWEHTHTMQKTANGTELVDHIEIEHPQGWRGLLTRLFFGGLPLRFLFIYRHMRTRLAVRAKKEALRH